MSDNGATNASPEAKLLEDLEVAIESENALEAELNASGLLPKTFEGLNEAPPEYRSLETRLPAGTKLDLTLSTITVEGTPYSLPEMGAAIPSTIKHKDAKSFTTAEWLAVARRANLLNAVDLEALVTTGRFRKTERTALDWMVPKDDPVDISMEQEVVTTSFSSEFERSQAIGGTTSLGGHIETPWVSTAAKMSSNQKSKSASKDRTLYMLGLYPYPHARLNLSLCTTLSARFLDEVRNAIACDADEQADALEAIFRRYGHVVPKEVTLGGCVTFTKDVKVHGEEEEYEAEKSFQAAVDIKVSGSGGGAEFAQTDGDHVVTAQSTSTETIKFHGKGGLRTKVNNIPEWINTTEDPNNWQVIEYHGVRSLLDILKEAEPELASSVLEVWNRHRRAKWAVPAETKDRVLPRDEPLPVFDNRPFLIVSAKDAAFSKKRTKDSRVAGLGGRYGNALFFNAVPRITLCDPNDLSRPAEHGLLWRLVYTGLCTRGHGRGQPIYWIVAHSPEMDSEKPLDFSLYWPKPDGSVRVLAALAASSETYEPEISLLNHIQLRALVSVLDHSELERHPASFTVTRAGEGTFVFGSMTYQGYMKPATARAGKIPNIIRWAMDNEETFVPGPTTSWRAWIDQD